MAELTVELRHLLQSDFDLFDFEYQFDDPIFKKELEEAITEHYFFSEIGQETPDRFKQRFKTRWKRMIGYYNELYNTTLLTYNPLINSSISEGLNQLGESTSNQDVLGSTTSKQDVTGLSSNEGSTTSETDTTNTTDTTGNTLTTNNTQTITDGSTISNTNEIGSDYPQQSIAGGDYRSDAKTSDGTSSNESTSKNTGTVNTDNSSHSEGLSTNSGTTTSTDDGTTENHLTGSGTTENEIVSRGTNKSNYEKTIEGLTGTTYQELIRQERSNLLRITDNIIEEMKPSFYLVY